MQKEITNFLHNGSVGDVWASIPAMKEYNKITGKKIDLYLMNGQKAFYYEGAVHPTRNEDDEEVMLNEAVIKMMIPLIKAQPFINDCKIWNKELIHVDLNRIRETNVGMPNGCISRWYFLAYPDMACDLTEKWIEIPETNIDYAKNRIIVTRTERYLNKHINYKFLKSYEKDILFCGTDLEYAIFNARFGLNIRRLLINNFLELAQALKQCKFHISNQTQAFQLSQGLKIPRILEHCTFAPNVIPIGKDAYDFLAQDGLEFYFHKLNGTLEPFFEQKRKEAALKELKEKTETGTKKAAQGG